jgi:hypothetical protein
MQASESRFPGGHTAIAQNDMQRVFTQTPRSVDPCLALGIIDRPLPVRGLPVRVEQLLFSLPFPDLPLNDLVRDLRTAVFAD